MVNGRLQEVEIITNNKADLADLDLVKNNKANIEDIERIETQIQEIRSHMINLEGEDKEQEPDSDGITPVSNSSQYKRYTRNIYGYGDEIYKIIKQEQKKGNSVGIKKHLRYHQLQLNEICDRIVYDEDRFNNMRKEILTQRQQLTKYQEDNQVLKEKVEKSEVIMKQVEDTLQSINLFKNQIENDRDSIFAAVLKVQNDSAVLANKYDKVKTEFENGHNDKIKRIVTF